MPSRNPQRTSPTTTPSVAAAARSSQPLFGLRFWLTCCFVSLINQAFYNLANFISSSSSSPPSSSLSNSFPLLQQQQQQQQQQEDGVAAWSPMKSVSAATAAAVEASRFDGGNRALRGTTLAQQPEPPEQSEIQPPLEQLEQPSQLEQPRQPLEQPSLPVTPALLPPPPPPSDPGATGAAIAVATPSDNISKTKTKKGLSSAEEAEYWSQNGCIYVENLCHSTYRFFYDTPYYDDDDDDDDDESDHFETGHDSSPYQPNLELDLQSVFRRGYPANIKVGRGKPSELVVDDQHKCHYSPISHHLMYSTPFNHMMVEYYIRTMTGLKPILQNHAYLSQHPSHLQLYVILYNYAKILDGHRLFTNTLSTSNPLLPFQELLDSTHCTCMKKAVFCGFKRNTKKVPIMSSMETTTSNIDQEVVAGSSEVAAESPATAAAAAAAAAASEVAASEPTAVAVVAAANETTAVVATEEAAVSQNVTTWSVLRPFADIGGMGIYREKRRYPGLRKHVRTELFDGHNQIISNMVKDYRLKQIRLFRNSNVELSQVDDYILIGLTQRTGRRRWSNLKKVLNNCNTYEPFVQAKIICIEVNMDNASSHVLQQAVIHGSIQAFVGIHGSHFVNAVMLPKGATILEFQPWFPDWMRFGREWARRTDIATPVGSMFFNSDLNHVGLALERSSAPQLCSNHVMGSVEDHECLYALSETDRDAIWWGTRDFSISWSIVQAFIQQFMMPGESKPDLCDDFKKIQTDHQVTMEGTNRSQSFSLYNVNCRDTVTSTRIHTWHSYNNYTLDEEAQLKVLVQEGMDKPPSKRKAKMTPTSDMTTAVTGTASATA